MCCSHLFTINQNSWNYNIKNLKINPVGKDFNNFPELSHKIFLT